MQRRRYLAAVGSLAAAGAAGLGTGAFTTAEANRDVAVDVAADSQGFVELTAENDTYAAENDDGQVEINFNEESDVGIFDGDAQGLTPDSTYNFAGVFQIANVAGLGDMRFVVERQGFDVDVELTASGDEALDIPGGTSLVAADYDDVDDIPKLVQPDACLVDMTITTGESATEGAGGTLVIHAATGGNRDKLSDVL